MPRECSIALDVSRYSPICYVLSRSRRCIRRADIYRLLVDGEHKKRGVPGRRSCFHGSMRLLPIAGLVIREPALGERLVAFLRRGAVGLIFLEDGLQVLAGG